METIISENRAGGEELREMFTQFIQHAADEHTKIREEIMMVAKMASETRARVSHVEPGMPHPKQRAEDYEEKIALTLSRKDFWRLVGISCVVLFLLVGIALIAGREGLTIWKPMATKITP